jgi:hypothetical protein
MILMRSIQEINNFPGSRPGGDTRTLSVFSPQLSVFDQLQNTATAKFQRAPFGQWPLYASQSRSTASPGNQRIPGNRPEMAAGAPFPSTREGK